MCRSEIKARAHGSDVKAKFPKEMKEQKCSEADSRLKTQKKYKAKSPYFSQEQKTFRSKNRAKRLEDI